MSSRTVKAEVYAPNSEIIGEYDKKLSAKCENGTFVGYLEDHILTFKGIPYAQPPVRELRWKLPQHVTASDKVFEAHYSSKMSIQPPAALDSGLAYEMGEDCLGLNIYINSSDKTQKKAVMVWIHGGEFLSGGTAKPSYDGYNFVDANSDVILVTINYRLSLMGFVDFSEIEGGENYPNGNLGTFDQIEAIRWVKRNIAAFGGDPECITVFGESAGGASVSALCVTKEAKGLFKRAIIQSGAVNQNTPSKIAASQANNLAKAFDAKNMDDLIAIPEDKLIEHWQSGASNLGHNYLVIDGCSFKSDPLELWENGVSKDLEIMQGFMAEEWGTFIPMLQPKEFFDALNKDVADRFYDSGNDEYKRAYDEYKDYIKNIEKPERSGTDFMSEHYFQHAINQQLAAHAKNGGRGYAYVMDLPSAAPGIGAGHMLDVNYIFGDLDGKFAKDGQEDLELSRKMQKMWTNFAKTGNPSTDDTEWPEYDLESRKTMMLNYDAHVENDPWKERREFFEKMGSTNPDFNRANTIAYNTNAMLEHYPQFKKEQ